MATGRQLAQHALHEPMKKFGWRPRAAGWFTREIAPELLGVVAVSAASSGYKKGTADVSVHVGLRDESVEPLVARLCAMDDRGYQSRTVVTSLGYLMPERRWRDWFIDADTADDIGAELARHVDERAWPYLEMLGIDARALLDQARAHSISWPGDCRVAVLTARLNGKASAEALLGRVNVTVPAEQQMLTRLREWLSEPNQE